MKEATRIRGDGVGPEMIDAASRVMEAAGARIAWRDVVAGQEAYGTRGEALPRRATGEVEAALKGAIA